MTDVGNSNDVDRGTPKCKEDTGWFFFLKL